MSFSVHDNNIIISYTTIRPIRSYKISFANNGIIIDICSRVQALQNDKSMPVSQLLEC